MGKKTYSKNQEGLNFQTYATTIMLAHSPGLLLATCYVGIVLHK